MSAPTNPTDAEVLAAAVVTAEAAVERGDNTLAGLLALWLAELRIGKAAECDLCGQTYADDILDVIEGGDLGGFITTMTSGGEGTFCPWCANHLTPPSRKASPR